MDSNTLLPDEKHFPYHSGPGVAFITISVNGVCYQIMYCPYMITNERAKTDYHPLQIRLVKCFVGSVNNGDPIFECVSLFHGFEGAKRLVYSLIKGERPEQ